MDEKSGIIVAVLSSILYGFFITFLNRSYEKEILTTNKDANRNHFNLIHPKSVIYIGMVGTIISIGLFVICAYDGAFTNLNNSKNSIWLFYLVFAFIAFMFFGSIYMSYSGYKFKIEVRGEKIKIHYVLKKKKDYDVTDITKVKKTTRYYSEGGQSVKIKIQFDDKCKLTVNSLLINLSLFCEYLCLKGIYIEEIYKGKNNQR